MIFQTHSLPLSTFVVGDNPPAKASAAVDKTESLSAILIALCTTDVNGFFANKMALRSFPAEEVCTEASRLLEKNSRSFRLLSIVSHSAFFSDWECEEPENQVVLFAALALHSINKTTKEAAFHRVAKAIRREVLARKCARTPTKIRLRDCHLSIAQFMQEYASVSEVNRTIVLTSLAVGEASGCGHLPSQQAAALMKRLGQK